MRPDEIVRDIEAVREEFQREEDQGLLQRDLHKACMALAGKDACDRVLRRIAARPGVVSVVARSVSRVK